MKLPKSSSGTRDKGNLRFMETLDRSRIRRKVTELDEESFNQNEEQGISQDLRYYQTFGLCAHVAQIFLHRMSNHTDSSTY